MCSHGTIYHGIHYKKVQNSILIGYGDIDWGGDIDDLKGTSGRVQHCFRSSFMNFKEENCCYTFYYISLSAVRCQELWIRWMLK